MSHTEWELCNWKVLRAVWVYGIGFEVLTDVIRKSTIFCGVTPYRQVKLTEVYEKRTTQFLESKGEKT
jgi:hypothetical protein